MSKIPIPLIERDICPGTRVLEVFNHGERMEPRPSPDYGPQWFFSPRSSLATSASTQKLIAAGIDITVVKLAEPRQMGYPDAKHWAWMGQSPTNDVRRCVKMADFPSSSLITRGLVGGCRRYSTPQDFELRHGSRKPEGGLPVPGFRKRLCTGTNSTKRMRQLGS